MEAFYSFNERFAKIRSKRIKKAIKGITGKSFPDTDEPEQDNPSTSKTTKKKEASSSSRGRGRGKRNNSSEIRNVESPDKEIGDPNSFADIVELEESNKTNKRKKGKPSPHSRGRGRSRKNAGHDATGSQVDSDTKCSSSASDDESHKRHKGSYKSQGIAPRRSSRERKQVTYIEDGDEADDNDVPMHQNNENDPSEDATNTDMVGEDTEFDLVHQNTNEPNSNQVHADTGTAKDINEDSQGFELPEDHQADSAPKDYLFTGGGFCMVDDGEQEPAGDRSGAEMPGTSDPCDDTDGVSDSGKSVSLPMAAECIENASMEAKGASSSLQRRKASRGLSAMPTLTKRRRKS